VQPALLAEPGLNQGPKTPEHRPEFLVPRPPSPYHRRALGRYPGDKLTKTVNKPEAPKACRPAGGPLAGWDRSSFDLGPLKF